MNFKKLKFLLKYGSFNPKRIDGIDCETWRNINIGRDGLFLAHNPDNIVYEMYIRALLAKDEVGGYLNDKQVVYIATEIAIHATTVLYGHGYTDMLLEAWERRKKILENA